MRIATFLFPLICFAFYTPPLWSAQVILPMGVVDEISTKQVPLFPVIAWKGKGDPFARLDEAYLKLARYTVSEGLEPVKPLVIELPDLDWSSAKNDWEATIYLPLPQSQEWHSPKDRNLYLEEREANRVISLAFRGAYQWEVARPQLEKLKSWLKQNKIVMAGRPRLLLYHYRSFRPNGWRSAEWQLPVR
ncbi:MAG: heme-binding protein [Verrucomicrobiae bacterium]|nr:heme-binding protein [Verrucomicrobiae bacterium]